MSQIQYRKQSLFDAPKNAIIIHACNAQGIWGAGIAEEFADRYPGSYEDYRAYCKESYNVLGTGALSWKPVEESHWVGWIITSEGFGKNLDSPAQIKANTAVALFQLCKDIMSYERREPTVNVYSNKFNSGMFRIPWSETEIILKAVLRHFPKIRWIVCDPELDEK